MFFDNQYDPNKYLKDFQRCAYRPLHQKNAVLGDPDFQIGQNMMRNHLGQLGQSGQR